MSEEKPNDIIPPSISVKTEDTNFVYLFDNIDNGYSIRLYIFDGSWTAVDSIAFDGKNCKKLTILDANSIYTPYANGADSFIVNLKIDEKKYIITSPISVGSEIVTVVNSFSLYSIDINKNENVLGYYVIASDRNAAEKVLSDINNTNFDSDKIQLFMLTLVRNY